MIKYCCGFLKMSLKYSMSVGDDFSRKKYDPYIHPFLLKLKKILCKNVATDIKTVLYVVIGRYSPRKITKKSVHRNFDVKNGMA